MLENLKSTINVFKEMKIFTSNFIFIQFMKKIQEKKAKKMTFGKKPWNSSKPIRQIQNF